MRKQLHAWICLLVILSFLIGCAGCGKQAADPAQPNDTLALKEAYDNGYAEGASAAAQDAYERGYRDGYAEGKEIIPSVPEPEEDSAGPSIPDGFVLVSDLIPDVMLDIRYYSTYNFVGTKIDGYDAPAAILTTEAAEALKQVSDELGSQGYRLKIYDAYRPQCAVDHFKRWAEDIDDTLMKDYFYPHVDKKDLFHQGYIASRSGHSRGSTVDLTLFDMRTGKDADMGGTFDYFGMQSHADYTKTLTEEQIQNRQLLRNAMLSHGFRGISTEWWHFTLQDEPYPDQYFNFPVSSH